MVAMKLFRILRDLNDEEFNDFKWILKKKKVGDIEPIQESQIYNADRRRVVDLMVQRYESALAEEVTVLILKEMERPDLVTKLMGAQGPGPAQAPGGPAQAQGGPAQAPGGPAPDGVPADKKLFSIRSNFVDKVSDPNLNQILDRLLQQGILNDEEMQVAKGKVRVEKARDMIDMVRRKGPVASSALIAALLDVDPVLSELLNLS
ncbi:uncharacterized protein [Pempheris klunzingeri]|uniref:uncharacterized protein n=1 Tax=Pempheris klunzingeri TaxID=3127111 RepID=UPI003980ED3C